MEEKSPKLKGKMEDKPQPNMLDDFFLSIDELKEEEKIEINHQIQALSEEEFTKYKELMGAFEWAFREKLGDEEAQLFLTLFEEEFSSRLLSAKVQATGEVVMRPTMLQAVVTTVGDIASGLPLLGAAASGIAEFAITRKIRQKKLEEKQEVADLARNPIEISILSRALGYALIQHYERPVRNACKAKETARQEITRNFIDPLIQGVEAGELNIEKGQFLKLSELVMVLLALFNKVKKESLGEKAWRYGLPDAKVIEQLTQIASVDVLGIPSFENMLEKLKEEIEKLREQAPEQSAALVIDGDARIGNFFHAENISSSTTNRLLPPGASEQDVKNFALLQQTLSTNGQQLISEKQPSRAAAELPKVIIKGKSMVGKAEVAKAIHHREENFILGTSLPSMPMPAPAVANPVSQTQDEKEKRDANSVAALQQGQNGFLPPSSGEDKTPSSSSSSSASSSASSSSSSEVTPNPLVQCSLGKK